MAGEMRVGLSCGTFKGTLFMQPLLRPFRVVIFLPLVLLANSAGADFSHAADRLRVEWDQVRDVEDEATSIAAADWKVIFFLGAECPLARLYGQRLSRLAAQFSSSGVRVLGVSSNPQDSVDDIHRYISDLEATFPIIKDGDQKWARQFGATRTAEVFVLDADDQICYQGRIDDQYVPGISRAAPQQHDLRDALSALIAGRAPTVAKTPPVGCRITFLNLPRRRLDNAPEVTFARDVAPILNQHCVECHRPGEIGPFALTDYDEVVGWGEMMLEVIDQGRMPPWHADRQFGKFVGSRHLPSEARKTLKDWVAQGMPPGDTMDMPAQPEWVDGWQLPEPPDAQFAMRGRPFVVPAEGTVEYQYFVVDPEWEEDRWIRAAQVVPGNAAVVHHAIVFVRAPDGSQSGGIGWLGGYVPGQRLQPLPPGHARRVPAGAKLVFQMHYTPSGREIEDVTKIGLWYGNSADITHEVTTRVALNHDFEIPPGAKDHTVEFQLSGFAREARLLSAAPHMHLRGKSFRLIARRQDQRDTLLHVPHYDFNWQHLYRFESPPQLADITSLDMQICFDNSGDNLTNPDPDQYVTWGDQTWQEMAVAFFDVAHPCGQSREIVRHQSPSSTHDEALDQAKISKKADHFLAAMDRDGDGVVMRDEVPDAFRLFGFRRMDHDRDGRLQLSEIEAEAAGRIQ